MIYVGCLHMNGGERLASKVVAVVVLLLPELMKRFYRIHPLDFRQAFSKQKYTVL